jgi:hypothetical protein
MTELIHEAFGLHNLPLTVLLGLVVGYWLLVILGAMDADSDVGVDVEGDGIPDHMDGQVSHGCFALISSLFSVGQVPFMIVISVLTLSMWLGSLLANYYFNGTPDARSAWTALGIMVPNFIVALILTRILLWPVAKLFSAMDKNDTGIHVIGAKARVVSIEVDETYGQVEIADQGGAPALLNVRTIAGAEQLPRNAIVKIIKASDDGSFYFVEPVHAPP